MELSFFDHLFVAVFIVGIPLHGTFVAFPTIRKWLAEDAEGLRFEIYRETVVGQWVATFLLALIWVWNDRPRAVLGFGLHVPPDGVELLPYGDLGALGLTAVAVIYCVFQVRRVRHAGYRQKILLEAERQAPFLPRDAEEQQAWVPAAMTAGICEEVLLRGYAIWYLSAFVGPYVAAAIAAVWFGIVHSYQGWVNVAKVIAAAVGFTALYFLTGGLWLAMALHAFVDWHAGRLHVLCLLAERGGSRAS